MKLLIAIIAKDDKDETESALTREGFMLTELATTGGFLKRKNVTLLIGTTEDKVNRVKELLRTTAGKRSVKYFPSAPSSHHPAPGENSRTSPSVVLESETGGCTVFELSAADMYKF